ncbi:FRG domain-containing protein [Clavibacter zhangzhiyongii]|uniref:FRG domain-containing protein n=2 Tax=Clavibacter zhangzhiyongii TaxID=2768071 RepID=A0A7L7Z1S2_9MICO|nr:FRG domain-containing protein [Clavibacter zhangzhiyongii]
MTDGVVDEKDRKLGKIPERVENGYTIYTVSNPTELTQVAGWLRYNTKEGVALFRGQVHLYSEMLATGLRSRRDTPGRTGLSKNQLDQHGVKLRAYIDTLYGAPCSCGVSAKSFSRMHNCLEIARPVRHRTQAGSVVSGTYRAVMEPLLQHYGLNTRWMDVVDNIWIALWFACYKQVSNEGFAHHARRSPAQEGSDAKAFILVFRSGPLKETAIPGYRIGTLSRLVDLRYSVPSIYHRPHAQHGLLIAPADLEHGDIFGSLKEHVVGVIEVALEDALDWLGKGTMTSPSTLFPPATLDDGYRRLLEYAPKPTKALGHLTIYGPGQ